MSRPTLTPEQTDAVARPRGDVVVLASAGSGKTTVLTERYVTLVARDGLDPRRVAALTFTDKAAGEMRRRIAEAFRRDPSLRGRAADVAFAPISTIHAYGARLLREHALVAGVDPAFVLLDEASADEALDGALDGALSDVEARMRGLPGTPLAVVRRIGGERGRDAVLALYRRLRELGHDPGDLRLARGPGLASAVDAYAAARRALDDAVATARLKPDAAARYAEVRADLPTVPEVEAGGFAVLRRLHAVAESRNNEAVGLPKSSRFGKEAREALRAACAAAAGAVADAIAAAEVEEPLRAVLAALDAGYTRAKRTRGALDFADLELGALRLLRRLAERGVELPGRPHALLVDEFQDVNPVQARLIEALRTCADGRRADRFAVGDPKQSIYRFRRADVAVMRAAWDEVGAAGQALLSTSFRTRGHLVALQNAFFPSVFGGEGGGPEEGPTDDPSGAPGPPGSGLRYAPLRVGATFHEGVAPALPELLVVDVADTPGPAALHEARAVAARIRALVDGGALRAKVDRAAPDAPPRPLQWRDFAILLRAQTHVKAVERGLLEAGVPFQVGKGSGFYHATEIEDLLHLLRVVHDPLDRYALAAFLASPAVGASDADLFDVFGPGGDGTSAMEPIDVARAHPSLGEAVAGIDDLRRISVQEGLETLVAAAVHRFQLLPVAMLQAGGTRRARNLAKAIAIARSLDDQGRHGLFDLLRRVTDLIDREVREAEAASAVEGDAVSVLTVHAAKGLEWPAVFLLCAGSGAKDRTDEASALLDREGGVALRLRDPLEGGSVPTGAHRAVAALERAADAAEASRLLYVALTRAEERLVVSATARGRRGDGRPTALSGPAGALWDWLDPHVGLGSVDVERGGATVRVTVETPRPAQAGAVFPFFARVGAAGVLDDATYAPAPAALARATAAWAAAEAPLPSLGRTPYVASVSALLAFARSPAAYYRDRLVGADAAHETVVAATRIAEREDPGLAEAEGTDPGRALAGGAERYDEGRDVVDGVDRAALGRAVHLALERCAPGGAPEALDALVLGALADEGVPPEPRVSALARAMVARALGTVPLRAIEQGLPGRREAAFHARVRFPEGEPVAGFEALLVKGTIDLWVTAPDGRVTIHDFKTNAPSAALPDAEAILSRYALQMQLYALAVERIVGRDVAGASLLLLDPAWARRGVAVELPVDVSGPRLLAARRVVRAFAVAHHEERFPARLEDL